MPLPRRSVEFDFSYPRSARSGGWTWIIAVALHLPLLLVPLGRTRVHDPARPSLLVPLPSAARQESSVITVPYAAPGETRRALPLAGAAPRLQRRQPQLSPVPPAAITNAGAPLPTTPALAPADSASGPTARRPIAPAYGRGLLWVRPLPVSPQQLAAALRQRTDAEQVDSVVAAMIQGYLDRMAVEAAARPSPLPDWTTEIGGKTVGIDSKWIYLGPIRVPTILLGLLPLGIQANPTQADLNRRLDAMRADLVDAARRAATYADFKLAIGALREQKQRQRDFDKAQRMTPADTGKKP